MALSDSKLQNLKLRDKAYQEADEDGLFVEITPGGAKAWRLPDLFTFRSPDMVG